uniref:CH-like domain-containing protein n=1 Tax=Trypanosoma congolense (strain IL3000) TaxID=1068625 RepID=G0US40_TRYCI|nr:conserved hypothetical protein [Trypanosoma congolense IL3000]
MPEVQGGFKQQGLPREVISWLKCLQLPRSLRLPKRDLSNGFLVATICSRYWNTISMHSYEDKLSTTNKRDNWSQLKKHFQQKNCPLSDVMIEGMIACKEGYAEALLRQLYTVLTGREIVEAAPLPAVETTPPALIHELAPKVVNFEAKSKNLEEKKTELNRVRGMTQRDFNFLQQMEEAAQIPVIVDSDNQVLHSINRDSEDDKADIEGVDGGNLCERAPVTFNVSLRRSQMQPTVLQVNGNKLGRSPSSTAKDLGWEESGADQNNHGEVSVLSFIETIVQSQATGLKPRAVCDPSKGSSDPSEREASYVECFLRDELALGTLVQCRVWNALLSQVNDVASIILRDGSSLARVAALFMKKPPPKGQSQPPASPPQASLSGRASSPTPSTFTGDGMAQCGSQRFMFLASLMSNISDVDAFVAISMYRDDILPNAKEALMELDHITADSHASLLCAALPADRVLAAQALHDLMSSIYSAVTESRGVSETISFALLLCAVVTRLTRELGNSLVNLGGGQVASPRSDILLSPRSGRPEDPLSSAAFSIGGCHVVYLLSHESPAVRLTGVRLAEILASRGCPMELLLYTVLPLLSSCCSIPTSPLFSCVCAGWLQATLRRLCEPNADKGVNRSDGNSLAQTASATSLVLKESFLEEDQRVLPDVVIHQLAVIVRNVFHMMQRPGPMNARLHIAQQLALCINDFPPQNETQTLLFPDKIAVAVFKLFMSVPEECTKSFFSPDMSSRLLSSKHKREQMGGSCQFLVCSHILGPLVNVGRLCDCYPLALSEAVLVAFPPERCGDGDEEEWVRLPSSEMWRQGRMTHTSENGVAVAPTSRRGSLWGRSVGGTSGTQEVQISHGAEQRITWLYKIAVSCRVGRSFPGKPASLSEYACFQRWVALFRSVYSDILSLTASAEVAFTRTNSVVDDKLSHIAHLGGMAQQLVTVWYTEFCRDNLGSASPTFNGSGFGTERPSVALQAAAKPELMGAMLWYKGLCGRNRTGTGRSPGQRKLSLAMAGSGNSGTKMYRNSLRSLEVPITL